MAPTGRNDSMTLLRSFENPDLYRGGYVSIGNFDGVHRGHQEIAQHLAARSVRENVPAVILTFDPHPLALLRPNQVPPSLTTLKHKAEILARAGVTCVIVYPTDRELLQLTPTEFVDSILVRQLAAKGIIEGPNFCFGKDRKGDIDTLRELCRGRNILLEVAEPVGGARAMVSSSTIRSLIKAGKMEDAVTLLGHAYRIEGEVVAGARRGAQIGFPTANLAKIETLLPADGVYAGVTSVDGREFAAAVNIGPNPTFQENARKVEAHLLDFSGDLYGRALWVDLFERIREVRKFASRDQLIGQIEQDVAAARTILSRRQQT
jgi:riboflavin kinase / FMN adenylyltransferase